MEKETFFDFVVVYSHEKNRGRTCYYDIHYYDIHKKQKTKKIMITATKREERKESSSTPSVPFQQCPMKH